MDTLPKLTSSQSLMVDLLVARHRLGEPFWPISKELQRTYVALDIKGYVDVLPGHVDHTVRLQLTPRARKELIEDSTYVTPIERNLAAKIADKLEKKGGDPTTIRMIRKKFVA